MSLMNSTVSHWAHSAPGAQTDTVLAFLALQEAWPDINTPVTQVHATVRSVEKEGPWNCEGIHQEGLPVGRAAGAGIRRISGRWSEEEPGSRARRSVGMGHVQSGRWNVHSMEQRGEAGGEVQEMKRHLWPWLGGLPSFWGAWGMSDMIRPKHKQTGGQHGRRDTVEVQCRDSYKS